MLIRRSNFDSINRLFTEPEIRANAKTFLDFYNSYLTTAKLNAYFEQSFSQKASHCGIENLWEFANALMIKYYHNEAFVKYRFVESNMKGVRATCAFEMNVGSSRVDLCQVNGHSFGYEIKTHFDKLDRLNKQLDDYLSVFEFVYVICPEDRLNEVSAIAGDRVGIYTYRDDRSNPCFLLKREAILSDALDPKKQAEAIGLQGIENLNANDINALFKKAYTKKYHSKWAFFSANKSCILPLDYQWAFNHKVVPRRQYQSND